MGVLRAAEVAESRFLCCFLGLDAIAAVPPFVHYYAYAGGERTGRALLHLVDLGCVAECVIIPVSRKRGWERRSVVITVSDILGVELIVVQLDEWLKCNRGA